MSYPAAVTTAVPSPAVPSLRRRDPRGASSAPSPVRASGFGGASGFSGAAVLPAASLFETRPAASLPLGLRALPSLQLVDAMKIALRDLLRAVQSSEPVEPYRACRWCAARARWCAEGAPGLPDGATSMRVHLAEMAARAAASAGLSRPLSVRIGRRADPYPATESTAMATRRLLECLVELGDRADGMEISILTRSPLLLRDLDLLLELDQRHAVSVGVVIPAADSRLARRVEAHLPPLPAAAERFDLVRTLASQGIATRILCTPIVPGVNNSLKVFQRLLDLALRAGACDVAAAPRHPALPPTPFEAAQFLPLFQRLRLEHGFPRALPGRG
jgi:hypothetical protein